MTQAIFSARVRLRVAVSRFLALMLIVGTAAGARDKKARQEEGRYTIFIAGSEIGSEKYLLLTSSDSVQSTSVLAFHSPQNPQQRENIETKLTMNSHFTPLGYELKGDIGGKRITLVGRFSPNQVIFEYGGPGDSARHGLLVGDEYTILDRNVFHHFIFLARLYMDSGRHPNKRFEVVIPRENESGFLTIKELERQALVIGNKKRKCRHFQVDSGSLVIDLWADDQGILHKIAVPASGVEAIRND